MIGQMEPVAWSVSADTLSPTHLRDPGSETTACGQPLGEGASNRLGLAWCETCFAFLTGDEEPDNKPEGEQ